MRSQIHFNGPNNVGVAERYLSDIWSFHLAPDILSRIFQREMVIEQANSESEAISLREITRKNLRSILALSVTEEQKKVYPRSNAYSMAEGHYPADDDPVWMRAIYAGETPVGFLMTSEAPNQGEYFLWRIMIDAKHQNKGYGFQAVELLIKRIKATGNAKELITSHLKNDGDSGPFYQKLGFAYTGEILNGSDHLMKIDFQ